MRGNQTLNTMPNYNNHAACAADLDLTVLFSNGLTGGPAFHGHIGGALSKVAPFLMETLTLHWSTGQGTRVRHILWSLYTCNHLVNLGDACSGLDARLAEALAVAITARLILGPEVELVLREILEASGEFRRFDEIERGTPEHLPVVYPPTQADAETLRKMADAVDHSKTRGYGKGDAHRSV
jgi:hypothetical protein